MGTVRYFCKALWTSQEKGSRQTYGINSSILFLLSVTSGSLGGGEGCFPFGLQNKLFQKERPSLNPPLTRLVLGGCILYYM